MTRPRPRVVDDARYLWLSRREHGWDSVRCWRADQRRGALELRFDPSAQGNLAHASGVVTCGLRTYNLNRPAVVAQLIRAALARGWDPLGPRPQRLPGFALIHADPRAFTHEPIRDARLEQATTLIERCAARAEQHPLAWLEPRYPRPWIELLYARPAATALLAVAGLVGCGTALDTPADLDAGRRAELEVWVDARLAHGQPGGLIVAHWLGGAPIDTSELLADLDAWATSLL